MKYRIKEKDNWFTVQVRILWLVWLDYGYPHSSLESARDELEKTVNPAPVVYHPFN